MPSLVASLLASLGVYRLSRCFCDPVQSLLATALFATHGTVAFAAADARPYALALMAVVWAMLALVKWCESGRSACGVVCVFLLALSVYFHYLSVTVLPIFIYKMARQDRVSGARGRHVWGLAVLLSALLFALLPHAALLWGQRAEHSFSGKPAFQDMVEAVLYYRLAAGILLGAAIARVVYRDFDVRTQGLFDRAHFFLAAWYLFPILSLFLVSLFSDAKLFVPRYYLWGAPGLVILVASALSSVHPLPARRILGLVILLAFCAHRFPSGEAGHGGQDWRGALRAARLAVEQTHATLLLRSGFPEAAVGHAAEDSTAANPLMAPLAMYPVSGEAVLIPCWLKDADRRRLEGVVSSLIGRRTAFVFISPNDGPPTDKWLMGRLSAEEYRIESLGDFVGMTALAFLPSRAHASKEIVKTTGP
jgi:uncharacterized membrane protein